MAIRVKNLSNIGYSYPVESISRKFALRKEKVNTVHYRNDVYVKPIQAFMGGSVRKVRVDGTLVNANTFWIRKNARTTALTQREIQIRNAFTVSSQWVGEAMKDLSAITGNQLKFQESLRTGKTIKGVSAKNYTSTRKWMAAVAIEMRLNDEELPTSHQLPAFDA